MSEQDVVASMISFVEKKERELQSSKMSVEAQAKNDIVRSILDELERMTADED